MISFWRDERRRRWRLRKAMGAALSDAGGPITTNATPSCEQAAPLAPGEQFARACAIPPRARLSVALRSGPLLSLPLTEPVLFIGSGPECRLRLVNAGLDRRHYALFWLSGSLYGIDLHRAQRQPERVVGRWWTEDTVVHLGPFRLRAERIAPALFPAEKDRNGALPLQLQWVAGERTHIERLRARLTLFGTGSCCTFQLRDARLAPVQAALVRTPRSLALIDLADNSWTRRAGDLVSAALLDPGDEFEIGRTVFQVASVWEDFSPTTGGELPRAPVPLGATNNQTPI